MLLVDVHNHILSKMSTELLADYGRPRYHLQQDAEGRTVVMRQGARFMTFTEPMFDPEIRLRAMDEWAEGSMAETVARVMNDHLAEVSGRWPGRFRGLASVPLQNVNLALAVARMRYAGVFERYPDWPTTIRCRR